ncbi:MAG: BRCT domain-containing protein [Bryobacteraceae bacterium]
MFDELFGRRSRTPVPQDVRDAFLDDDGQPLVRAFNEWRRNDRAIHELLGLAKGILADEVVSPNEVIQLGKWIIAHTESGSGWPLDVFCERLSRTFADGQIDVEECNEIALLLKELIGTGLTQPDPPRGRENSTRLPLSNPAPVVEFEGNTFVLTGKFYFGARKKCEQEILDRGGQCSASITQRTRFLVIGTLGSTDWIHSAYGRKIEKAVEYIQDGYPIAIVSEKHWSGHL